MTAGVAMARENTKAGGWIPFKFPSRIMMLSRSKAERAGQLNIGKKIKRRCHISAVRASKEVLPYMKIIFKNDAKMAAGIAKWLDLDAEMIESVAGNEEKAAEIIKLFERLNGERCLRIPRICIIDLPLRLPRLVREDSQ
jgi:hypothetical protein